MVRAKYIMLLAVIEISDVMARKQRIASCMRGNRNKLSATLASRRYSLKRVNAAREYQEI